MISEPPYLFQLFQVGILMPKNSLQPEAVLHSTARVEYPQDLF